MANKHVWGIRKVADHYLVMCTDCAHVAARMPTLNEATRRMTLLAIVQTGYGLTRRRRLAKRLNRQHTPRNKEA